MIIRIQAKWTRSVPAFLRVAYRVLLLSGAVALAWPAYVLIESEYVQWNGNRVLAAAEQRQTSEEAVVPDKRSVAVKSPRGTPVGKFEIPRLGLSYVLLEGTDGRTLDRSIGHIEDTAAIGEAGNIGIAGHRNTHFRKLEWLRRDDEIVLKSPGGEYRYRVEWIRLFRPADVEVLDREHGPAVTLVTCFPFEYVGSAPLRLIIRALPDANTRGRLQTMADEGAVR
jgi:sortase A